MQYVIAERTMGNHTIGEFSYPVVDQLIRDRPPGLDLVYRVVWGLCRGSYEHVEEFSSHKAALAAFEGARPERKRLA